jgi:hypothetical protein
MHNITPVEVIYNAQQQSCGKKNHNIEGIKRMMSSTGFVPMGIAIMSAVSGNT